jgi:hypothetical protein
MLPATASPIAIRANISPIAGARRISPNSYINSFMSHSPFIAMHNGILVNVFYLEDDWIRISIQNPFILVLVIVNAMSSPCITTYLDIQLKVLRDSKCLTAMQYVFENDVLCIHDIP